MCENNNCLRFHRVIIWLDMKYLFTIKNDTISSVYALRGTSRLFNLVDRYSCYKKDEKATNSKADPSSRTSYNKHEEKCEQNEYGHRNQGECNAQNILVKRLRLRIHFTQRFLPQALYDSF